ncbi:MAG TPA: hypothetical protein VMJ10_13005 [Kofleriaceae bacterium]|nr:hypothetical protein [Kofleriaceae bacterium]
MTFRTATAIAIVGLCACGTSNPPPNFNPPTPPAANDPAFTQEGILGWYLVGDAATPGDNTLTAIVTAPSGAHYVDAYVAGLPPIRMDEQANGFAMRVAIDKLPPGDYQVLFSANGSDTAFAEVPFHRSAAFYVLVSTDYDFSDPGTGSQQFMDNIHMQHPGMRITHFWAPYTYTDPAVTDTRRAALDTWIHTQRDTFHDEIGLHIHPYCNFVVDAGLTCVTDQSDVYPAGDTSGYTIMLGAYGRDNMSTLLVHAKDLFAQHGIAAPRTFRAGGWTATADTMFALQDNGYIADTSALNWKYIQSAWKGDVIASWTMDQWAPIDDTSQPYYPSQTTISETQPSPAFSLLEVPDNGVMADYVTTADMQLFFDEIFTGTALTKPATLMMGFHPSSGLSLNAQDTVSGFLTYADQHTRANGLGPVVYITLSDVTPAFPPN